MELIGLLGNDRMLKIAGVEKTAVFTPAQRAALQYTVSNVAAGGSLPRNLAGAPTAERYQAMGMSPQARAQQIQQRMRVRSTPSATPAANPATPTTPATPASKPLAPDRAAGVAAAERYLAGQHRPTTVGAQDQPAAPAPAPAAPAPEAKEPGVLGRAAGWVGERIPGVRHFTPGFQAIRDPATAGHLANLRAQRMGGAAGILPHIVGLSPFHTAAIGAGLGALFSDKDEGALAGAIRGAGIGGLGGYGLTRWRDAALRNEAGYYGGPSAFRKALAAGQTPQPTRPLPPQRVQPEPENALA